MAQHRTTTLPPPGFARALHLSALHRDGAVVRQTAAAEIVESRETWPDGSTGLSNTPGNPEMSGWVRLTPT